MMFIFSRRILSPLVGFLVVAAINVSAQPGSPTSSTSECSRAIAAEPWPGVTVKAVYEGQVPTTRTTSGYDMMPVEGFPDRNFFIDEKERAIYMYKEEWGTGQVIEVYRSGLTPVNISPGKAPNEVIMMFIRTVYPSNLGNPEDLDPALKLPFDDRFEPGRNAYDRNDNIAWKVFYRGYLNAEETSIGNLEPCFFAVEFAGGHSGGGMVTLPNGQVVFATGTYGVVERFCSVTIALAGQGTHTCMPRI